MAKAKPKEKPNDGSLERTARLAKKLLAVPKAEADRQQTKYERERDKRPR
jgi:hypothetical protein